MVRLLSAIPYYKEEGKEYIHIQFMFKKTGEPLYKSNNT
jgi:hypothetical protein